MKGNYFKIETGKGTYTCTYDDLNKGSERWIIKVKFKGHDTTGELVCPSNWARTMVFQFVDSIDANVI